MNVTLQVNAEQFGDDIKNVFAALTTEQRQALAADLLRAYMTQPLELTGPAKHSYLKDIKKVPTGTYNDYEWKREWEKPVFLHDVLFQALSVQMLAEYRAQIADLVKNDPQIQRMLQVAVEDARRQFPAAVHEAIVLSAGRLINDLGGSIATLMMRTDKLSGDQKLMVDRMQDSLRQLGQPEN
jgi:hypothetical protein